MVGVWVGVRVDGWMNRWIDGWMDGWVSVGLYGHVDKYADGSIDRSIAWVNKQTDSTIIIGGKCLFLLNKSACNYLNNFINK